MLLLDIQLPYSSILIITVDTHQMCVVPAGV
jgi:hypothetical protein